MEDVYIYDLSEREISEAKKVGRIRHLSIQVPHQLDETALSTFLRDLEGTQYRSLRISNLNLSADFFDLFAENTTIEELWMESSTFYGDMALEKLAKNKSLLFLDATRNGITKKGAVAIAEHPTLKTLVLERSNIGREGLIALAKNRTLTKLNLQESTAPDTIGLIMMSHNETLRELEMNVSDDVQAVIAIGFPNLHRLNLTGTPIDIFDLDTELVVGRNLIELDIAFAVEAGMKTIKSIMQSGVVKLRILVPSADEIRELAKSKNIIELWIDGVEMDREDIYPIYHNRTIQRFYVSEGAIDFDDDILIEERRKTLETNLIPVYDNSVEDPIVDSMLLRNAMTRTLADSCEEEMEHFDF